MLKSKLPFYTTATPHLWLMFVVATFAKAAIWSFRGRAEIAKNPALKWSYRRLVLGFRIFGNIPWLILGAGFELPAAFRVPFLIAFAITIVVYWIAGFYWLAFGGGAERLAAHPGILRGSPRDPWTIKMQFLVILGVVLVGSVLVISFFGFVAVPPIPFDYVLRSH
jgi:hypothetical protein